MFYDHAKITVKSGKGGDGAVAFRREKYVPMGGPAGGDGGRGGDVILKVDEGMHTLMDFKYKKLYSANSGENGMNKSMYGKNAENLVIMVPAGTVVYNNENDQMIGDLTENGQELVVAKGGRGGRGNIHFASSKNRAPEVAENGEPGTEINIRLELKLIADIGLIGFPSVGKSTLLSVATSAKPKIGAYQFTTLSPNLGMVQLDDGRDFVMADLPGLIEGASNGVGLGFQFLRHVERTKVLLHLVEMDPDSGRDPVDDYQKIRDELGKYDDSILDRPEIIVPTKMDVPGSDKVLDKFLKELNLTEDDVYPISSVEHRGVSELMYKAAEVLDNYIPPETDLSDVVETREYNYEAPKDEYKIIKNDDDTYTITGEKVERLLQMSNLDHQDGVLRFANALKNMGVDDRLREAGAKTGDLVIIDDFTFEYI